MSSFQYRALQPDGKIAEGEIEAGNRQEAFRQMEERGLRPIKLAERNGVNGTHKAPPKKAEKKPSKEQAPEKDAKGAAPMKISLGGGGKVTARMLETFTRLLSSLLAAGVPLSRALVILCKEAASPAAAVKWKQVHDYVIDGMSLADAMAKSPETFPRVYVAMVEAGETGGFLDVVLSQIADFQAREKEMRAKVMTALLYPTILLGLALAVLVFLLVFFIPRFQTIFTGFNAKLPALTQIIVSTSEVMRSYGIFLAIGIFILAFTFRSWVVSEQGKRAWEGLILRVPVI
ncbi:MAG TPA: type II secretion system F family protein, partial [Candidatus Saccharimonadales bacterium]|nr:type II secretion system F family protein [Candidatus Saccharimonadales bacterium]